MDEALIEHAQHDVDGEHGGEDQRHLTLLRVLEQRGRAREIGADGGGQRDLALNPADRLHRFADRDARRRVERQRDGGLLRLAVDGQRTD